MLNEDYVFPAVPSTPQSVRSLIKLAWVAYRGALRIGVRLFLLPCAILAFSSLPSDLLIEGKDPFSVGEMMKVGAVTLIGFLGWIFFTLAGVFRTLSLRRLMFFPDDGCASSIAYAYRVGWKSILARIATGSLQLISFNILLITWLIMFVKDSSTNSGFGAFQDALLQPQGLIGALVSVSIGCAVWFFIEFWYMCFSTSLAVKDAGMALLIMHAWKMSKSSFWRGCGVAFALGALSGIAAFVLSPLFLYNLPNFLQFNVQAIAEHHPPFALCLLQTVISVCLNLFVLPFLAIFSAYFANDAFVRLNKK